jgi:hypothetical protein
MRDTAAARRFFIRALAHGPTPVEVRTDRAGPYVRVLDELVPAAAHVTEQYANKPDRSRSWPAEGSAASDARAETLPIGHTNRQRPR